MGSVHEQSPKLPAVRGRLSGAVISALAGTPRPVRAPTVDVVDPVADDDLQLALYCCYELHYRGFAGVDNRWEWSPALLSFRSELEAAFNAVLPHESTDGPSLSSYLERYGTADQFREFCIHRSAYQLKEGDPHTWAIPRVTGRTKAAMVAIQADEYGGGREGTMHATLFARTMHELGLDPTYGAYLDQLPGTTLATVNLVSMFGLHRRFRGALVGHLTQFEATSVAPMQRYSNALERLGLSPRAREFYDVHVEADVHHEVLAVDEMAAGLVDAEPHLAPDIDFGAAALTHVETRFATALLDAWASGRTSLLT